MELSGKLIDRFEPISGQSARGEWRKREFLIETSEQYPKRICISAWGDKVDELGFFKIGEKITCHINLESREHNGRYFTEVKCWKFEKDESIEEAAEHEHGNPQPLLTEADDLPF